jgi:hypothetical protein
MDAACSESLFDEARTVRSSAPVCTENLIRVDAVMESPKLAGMILQVLTIIRPETLVRWHRAVESLVDRLIPPDPQTPGGRGCRLCGLYRPTTCGILWPRRGARHARALRPLG